MENSKTLFESKTTKILLTAGTLRQALHLPWSSEAHTVTLPLKAINSARISVVPVPNFWVWIGAFFAFLSGIALGAYLGSHFTDIAAESLWTGGAATAALIGVAAYYFAKHQGWKKWAVGMGGIYLAVPLAIECVLRGFGNQFEPWEFLFTIARHGQSARGFAGWLAGVSLVTWIAWSVLKNYPWKRNLGVLTVSSASGSIRFGTWDKDIASLTQVHEEVVSACGWDNPSAQSTELKRVG